MFDKNPVLDAEPTEVSETEFIPFDEPEMEDEDGESPEILDELIIEEVNIDGMCGVY